jgi:hypothetical protein
MRGRSPAAIQGYFDVEIRLPHRFDSHRDVSMACDKNDGNLNPRESAAIWQAAVSFPYHRRATALRGVFRSAFDR